MIDPFERIHKACNTGDPMDKYKNLPAFPKIIDIELTNSCNFRCLMCPTGNLSMDRKAGFMDKDTYSKIIKEIAPHGTAIRFVGWGEPLLHPDIIDFIDFASTMGLLTHINTNGSKMDMKMAEDLVRVGLRSIKFSFQGVNKKTYEEMRQTDFFRGMSDSLFRVIHQKEAQKMANPFISISTSTTYETKEEIQAFKDDFRPFVDKLSVGKTVFDFMDMSKVRVNARAKKMLKKLADLEQWDKAHPDPCPEVFDKLNIHWDGSVGLCCNDFDGIVDLGNVNETPIEKIWMHEGIEAYRKRLSVKDYDAPLCNTCFDYQGLTEGAKK